MTQLQEPPRQKRFFQKRFLLLGLLLLIGAVVAGILNAIGLLPGPWSNILQIVFAGSGVIIPLLQWWWSSPAEIASETQSSLIVQQRTSSIQAQLGISKRKGALIRPLPPPSLAVAVY